MQSERTVLVRLMLVTLLAGCAADDASPGAQATSALDSTGAIPCAAVAVASASGSYNTANAPMRACDDDAQTFGWGNDAHLPAWLAYELVEPAVVTGYRLSVSGAQSGGWNSTGYSPTTWQLQASNDGVSWTTLDARTVAAQLGTLPDFTFVNTAAFRQYRLSIVANGGGGAWVHVTELVLLGELAPPPPSPPALPCDALDGAAASSSYNAGNAPSLACDGDTTTYGWGNGNALPAWLEYDLARPAVVSGYRMFVGAAQVGGWASTQYSPTRWELQASDDGVAWVTLDTRTYSARFGQLPDFVFANTTAYRRYRLAIAQNGGGAAWVHVTELQLLGALAPAPPTPPTIACAQVSDFTASSSYPANEPARACDGDATLSGWGNANALPAWLEYDFPGPAVVSGYRISVSAAQSGGWTSTAYNPIGWRLEGSDDGQAWVTLDARSHVVARFGQLPDFVFDNAVGYRRYRLAITENGGGGAWVHVTELQLLGTAPPVPPTPPTVPCAGVAATASSSYAPSNAASRACDGDLVSFGWGNANALPAWLQYDLAVPTAVGGYRIFVSPSQVGGWGSPGYNPVSFRFLGSNDGAMWTVLDTRVRAVNRYGALPDFLFDNHAAYRSFRLDVSENGGGGQWVHVTELQLLGVPTPPETTCGNGITEAGEACDGGPCCTATCTLAGAGLPCRAAAGACDVPELCTGTDAACPEDRRSAPGTECRAAAGACDVAELCDGVAAACPPDAFAPAQATCRPAVGACDVDERCTGLDAECPPDTLTGAGTPCRGAAGPCDVDEACTGADAECPVDRLLPAGVICHAPVGACDLPQACTGDSPACPPEALAAAGTICRPSRSDCDPAEACAGAIDCPPDRVATSGTRCGAGACASCDDGGRCVDGGDSCFADRWFHTDRAGSVIAISDEQGALSCAADYQPFGEAQGPGCGERQYNGRVKDEGTGLYEYGARYYDPDVGRFISADPERGTTGDLQSQNRYAYVLDNPYGHTDPSGHAPDERQAPVPSYLYAYVEAMRAAADDFEMQVGATLHLLTKGRVSIGTGAMLAGIGMALLPGGEEEAAGRPALAALARESQRIGGLVNHIKNNLGLELQRAARAQVEVIAVKSAQDVARAASYNGGIIWVVRTDGQLVVARASEAIHHSVLAGGANVAAAGEAEFVNGVPHLIDRRSGHYQPEAQWLELGRAAFESVGIVFPK